jgi:hypothetical protein
MAYKLIFTAEARGQLVALEADEKKLKRVRKCLGYIETNPRHPGLHSHKYSVMKTEDRRDLWESYVENNRPAAWRVFWFYGPGSDETTVTAITPHL